MSTLTHPLPGKLQAHQPLIAQQHLRTLFANDPQRFEKFSLTFNDILLDYSKQYVTTETMRLLLALARQQGLASWITRLFEETKSIRPNNGLHYMSPYALINPFG